VIPCCLSVCDKTREGAIEKIFRYNLSVPSRFFFISAFGLGHRGLVEAHEFLINSAYEAASVLSMSAFNRSIEGSGNSRCTRVVFITFPSLGK
jgi:hypothetical protein